MDLYHSRLTQDDLNELIIKYKFPHDLHPWLPSKGFVMSELLDDAIGVYHRIFDFSSVRIPFSSFLLSLIKHYKVYFSQLSSLGLNKVVTFEVLFQSMQIEPTVTLFRVFPTLCKQGHWFSFAKHHALSPVCIDDNNLAIYDPKPPVNSYNMEDFRGVDGNVMGIHDFLCLPSGPVLRFRRSLIMILGLICRGFLFIVPSATIDVAIPNPTLEDLAIGNPSAKVIAKAEASQK
ncbi:hypothetical protein Tco_0467616 [Tanacetum coccineum]